MLYATAARASEVLALDVEDLDVGRKRAAISGKGGHREIIVWDAATARLLPRYLAGRRQGPLFVTTGLPNIVPAELDRSPEGRGRLSYQRAWSLFREASGGQWTLHQLRHSALTHLGEDGVSAPCSWPSHAIETSGRSRATCVRGPKRLPNSPPSTTRQGVGSIHGARAVTHRNTRIPFHCYSDPNWWRAGGSLDVRRLRWERAVSNVTFPWPLVFRSDTPAVRPMTEEVFVVARKTGCHLGDVEDRAGEGRCRCRGIRHPNKSRHFSTAARSFPSFSRSSASSATANHFRTISAVSPRRACETPPLRLGPKLGGIGQSSVMRSATEAKKNRISSR